jgi:hypothetical protein
VIRAPEFPDTCKKFPVLRNIFPVNLSGELLNKWLQHSGFLRQNRLQLPQNRKIPVKFPDSREISWRRVQSALQRQPASHGVRETSRGWQKGPQLAGFCDLVGRLQTPEFTESEANLRKVSARCREYSRFRETFTGDAVRSPLGAGSGSRFHSLLRPSKPWIGKPIRGLPGTGRGQIRHFLQFRSDRIERPQSCGAARERQSRGSKPNGLSITGKP